MELIYRPFTSEYLKSIIDCIADVWCTDNRIAKGLGMTYDEMVPRATAACDLAIKSKYNLSTIVIHKPTNRVIAFTLCYIHPPFQTQIDFEETIKSYTPKSKAWAYFLRDVDLFAMNKISKIIKEADLPKSTPIVYADMGGIRHEYQKTNGLWSRIKIESGKVIAANISFKSDYIMFGVATHPITIVEMKKSSKKYSHHYRLEINLDDYAQYHPAMRQVLPKKVLAFVYYSPKRLKKSMASL